MALPLIFLLVIGILGFSFYAYSSDKLNSDNFLRDFFNSSQSREAKDIKTIMKGIKNDLENKFAEWDKQNE